MSKSKLNANIYLKQQALQQFHQQTQYDTVNSQPQEYQSQIQPTQSINHRSPPQSQQPYQITKCRQHKHKNVFTFM